MLVEMFTLPLKMLPDDSREVSIRGVLEAIAIG
jgi:hypothetical protein